MIDLIKYFLLIFSTSRVFAFWHALKYLFYKHCINKKQQKKTCNSTKKECLSLTTREQQIQLHSLQRWSSHLTELFSRFISPTYRGVILWPVGAHCEHAGVVHTRWRSLLERKWIPKVIMTVVSEKETTIKNKNNQSLHRSARGTSG